MIDLKRERPLSVVAAAQHFGVHRRTIEGWFRRGLERVKIGGRVYTSLEAVQRFSEPGCNVERQHDARAVGAAMKELRERFGLHV
jgi:hypothetical protein